MDATATERGRKRGQADEHEAAALRYGAVPPPGAKAAWHCSEWCGPMLSLARNTHIDAVLRVGAASVRSHRLVLSSCSRFLRALLENAAPGGMADVRIDDPRVIPRALALIVEFFYTGQLTLQPGAAALELLSTAHVLELPTVKRAALDGFLSGFHPTIAAPMLVSLQESLPVPAEGGAWADVHPEEHEAWRQHVMADLDACAERASSWRQLPPDALLRLFNQQAADMPRVTAEQAARAARAWMGGDFERLTFALQHLVPVINTPVILVSSADECADYGSLPAALLAQIAALAVAQAEETTISDQSRCAQCHQHVHLRCNCCTSDRAGSWSDLHIERDISDCVLGRPMQSLKTEDVTQYRLKLLGAVQSMRMVSKCWRASIDYSAIDNLWLDGPVDKRNTDGSRSSALAKNLPPDFSQRFAGVRTLDLSRLCLDTVPDAVRGMSGLRCLVVENHQMGALPDWTSELQLEELRLSYCYSNIVSDEEARSRHQSYMEWISCPQTRLPATLQRLSLKFTGSGIPLEELPPCIRYLLDLRSLSVTDDECCYFKFRLPEWLAADLSQLTSFQHNALASAQSARVLGSMSLSQLDIGSEEYGWSDDLLHALLAPSNPIRKSLCVLRISCHGTASSELPLCLRHLQLTALDLFDSDGLTTLPHWLGEMPLVRLGVAWTGLTSLPVSLRKVRTLRMIETRYSELQINPGDGTEEQVVRMKEELWPLAKALPRLKFNLGLDMMGPHVDHHTVNLTASVIPPIPGPGWMSGIWDPTLMPQLLEELHDYYRGC